MKKLRSKKGFTLAEMLISVLLLGFMTIMCTVMTSAVLSGTNTMQEVAQAEILGSVALENLEKEVRFAKNLRFTDDTTVVFDNTSFDKGYSPMLNGEGKVCMDLEGTLLFDGSSYGNLKVGALTFSQDNTSVVIAISISYGDKTLWNSKVAVKPINGIAV